MHRGADQRKLLRHNDFLAIRKHPDDDTHCSTDLFGFETVEGREVVAAFDGGAITSDAGALLLGAADRAIGLIDRCGVLSLRPGARYHTKLSTGTLLWRYLPFNLFNNGE
jgi:hypothetical protein